MLSDFETSRTLEWLETNGLGGYASSTVSGANMRRYHGLLVPSLHPPVDRVVAISKLDECIITGGERIELSANQYPGTVHPQGFHHLTRFDRHIFPEFYFRIGSIDIKKTIAAIHHENTTVVTYEVLSAPAKFSMELAPFYSCRDFHSLAHANDYLGKQYLFDNSVFQTMNYQGSPEIFIKVPDSSFAEAPAWYFNFEYLEELNRGLEFKEDLFTPGHFTVELKKGSKLGVILSLENPEARDAFVLLEEERARRMQLVMRFEGNEYVQRLTLAADQFVVKRGKLKSIIAGYPWFSDWGRDTMIALPGICLSTGRTEDAKSILTAFAKSTNHGMLPNRFPDKGETPEYNTLDATLWFFNAIYHYYQHAKDVSFIQSMLPVLSDIIHWHEKGTRYHIKVDPKDGLLGGGEHGVQLTWMDAKVGDWVVTPRRGKPVEINALWYNALCVMAFLLDETQAAQEASAIRIKAKRVKATFNEKFWNENDQCLYDYLDEHDQNRDIRPNQLYAISLPFAVLDKHKAEKVLHTVEDQLLTPRGLRSLSPKHSDYQPRYEGGVWQRDGAYHQGTVWSHLIGAYIDALVLLRGEKGQKEAVAWLTNFYPHLDEAGVGSVSEIFDAEPPHIPRGCIAQAWSVGELLRVMTQYKLSPSAQAKASVKKATRKTKTT